MAAHALAPADLAKLRVIVERGTRPPEREAMAATGVAALDALLGGGLPRRRMTEVVGRRSAGRSSLTLAALAAATARGEAVALVDVGGALDARSAEAAGIVLERLLWVNAGDLMQGLRAADLVLAAGGFGLVILDVGDALQRRAADASWLRLARAAERSTPGAALVVVSPSRTAGSFAALGLELTRVTAHFDRSRRAPPLLVGMRASVCVTRSKLRAPGEEATLEWRVAGVGQPAAASAAHAQAARTQAAHAPQAATTGASDRQVQRRREARERG